MKVPFSEGDRVMVTRHGNMGEYPALVLQSKRDMLGWLVLVLPEDSSKKSRWADSDQLTLLRADGAK